MTASQQSLVVDGSLYSAYPQARRTLQSRLRGAWAINDKVLRELTLAPATQYAIGDVSVLLVQYDCTLSDSLVVGWTTGVSPDQVIHEVSVRQLFVCDSALENVYLRNTQSVGQSSTSIRVKYTSALENSEALPVAPGVTSLTAANIVAAMQAGSTGDKQNLADILCAFLADCIDSRISESPALEAIIQAAINATAVPIFDAFGALIGYALPADAPVPTPGAGDFDFSTDGNPSVIIL